jgi:hypothetical protein
LRDQADLVEGAALGDDDVVGARGVTGEQVGLGLADEDEVVGVEAALAGAEVAAAVQGLEATEVETPETIELSAAARELVALRVLFAIVGRFVDGRPPATAAELGEDAHLPPGQVAWAVRQLAAVDGLIVEDGDGRLTPARDPRRMSPAEVLETLRQQGRAACWHDGDAAARAIEGLDRRAEEARQRVWSERTLAQLATDTAGEA